MLAVSDIIDKNREFFENGSDMIMRFRLLAQNLHDQLHDAGRRVKLPTLLPFRARPVHPPGCPNGRKRLSSPDWAAKRTSANRRKISPRIGPEYSWALSPELALNWSALSQSRFSRVIVQLPFSEGPIQIIRRNNIG